MLTTLLVLILGFFFIVAASRYYEDEKLFWKLIIPFIGVYAAGMVLFGMNSTESKKVPSEQIYVSKMYPMQALANAPVYENTDYLAEANLPTSVNVAAFDPAGSELYTSKIHKLADLEIFNLGDFIWKEPPILIDTPFNTS